MKNYIIDFSNKYDRFRIKNKYGNVILFKKIIYFTTKNNGKKIYRGKFINLLKRSIKYGNL